MEVPFMGSLAVWWFVLGSARAFDVPDVKPGQEVYVVPASYRFAVDRTRAAVKAAHNPVYVVVIEKVDDGDRGRWESFTEDALETTLAAWRADPDFHADVDSLVVLGMDEREVRIVAGSRWDADLGLRNETLLPLIDEAFLPTAKTGDLDGALAALAKRFDDEITDRRARKDYVRVPTLDLDKHVYTVPEGWTETNATEAAVRAAHVPTYVVLYQHVDDRERGVAKTFTDDAMDDTSGAWRWPVVGGSAALLVVSGDERRWATMYGGALVNAEHLEPHASGAAAQGNPDEAAAAAVAMIDPQLAARRISWPKEQEEKRLAAIAREKRAKEEEAAKAEADRIERERARQVRTAIAIGAPLGALALLLGSLFMRARNARRRFDAALAGLRAQLAQAEDNFQTFRADATVPDRIVELKMRGPVTLALAARIMALIDEIEVGVTALRRRSDGIAGLRPSPFSAAPWDRAREALEASFDFDTKEAQTRLFAGPTKVVSIEPAAFMASLDAKYAEGTRGWRRLLDAVAASMRTAQMDFPATDLEAMRASLAGAQLPEAWVAGHPLLADAEGEWAKLDALRRADPVAYLDALEAAIAKDDMLEADVRAVVAAVSAARKARDAVSAVTIDDLVTDTTGSPRDPIAALARAQAADVALDEEIGAAARVAELVEKAGTAQTGWEFVLACRNATRLAVAEGDRRLATATSAVDALGARIEAAIASVKAAAGEHASPHVQESWEEIEAARADLSEATQALATGRAAWAAGAHLRADDCAIAATKEHAEGVANLEDLAALLDQMAKEKATAEQALARLDLARNDAAKVLAACGAFADPAGLADGDRLLAELRARQSGAVDWVRLARDVQAVDVSWRNVVAVSRRRFRDDQERRERERAQREAAAAARAAASASVYSSIGSHHSSGASFSSGGHSAGGSFSSGGHSAGRSF